MAEGGPQEDKGEKKDPFDRKEDLFDATGGLKGGYDLGMGRAYALAHAKKTQGEYVGRVKDRRLLVWEMDSSRFDEDAECGEIVLSCQPEKAQVEQKGVWVYHVRAMGGLMPGTPIQKQSLAYTLPEAPRRPLPWLTYVAGPLGIAMIGGIIFYFYVVVLGRHPMGHIAFASNRDGNWEIYVMNADGTDQRRLTNSRAEAYDPAWGP